MDTNPFQLPDQAATEDVGFRVDKNALGDGLSTPVGSTTFDVDVSRELDDVLNQLNTQASDTVEVNVEALLQETPYERLDDVGALSAVAGEDSLSVFDIGPLKGLLSVMEGVNDGLEQEGFGPQSVQRLVEQFQSFQSGVQLF
ncbi:hypothetical protein ACQ4M3_20415 [Leptolyngbya sp. AN03gr2]|uniref:hypothetical protein n=1 Tax=unclassified Leptolyngbya TaxID=2650499 RepID=UPI003D3171EF